MLPITICILRPLKPAVFSFKVADTPRLALQKMKDVSGYLHISIDRCGQQAAGSVPVPGILALIKECFVAHISDIVVLVTEQPNLAVAIGPRSSRPDLMKLSPLVQVV